MTRQQSTIVVFLAIGVFVEFCLIGALAIMRFKALTTPEVAAVVGTPSPTRTSPPTSVATTVPSDTPTATWVVQRYAPRALPTPHPRVPGPLQDAWDKSSQKVSLRFEMAFGVQGEIAAFPSLSGYNPKTLLYDEAGESNGSDEHEVVKGYSVSLIGIDSAKGFEVAAVGDEFYIHGPAPYFGAPGNQWYYAPRALFQNGSAVQSPGSYQERNPDWTGFKKAANESFDSAPCAVYVAGQEASGRFFDDLRPDTLSSGIVTQLDDAETRVWICNDGYMHQLQITLTRHVAGDVKRQGSLVMRYHLYAFGSKIQIIAPKDALPLDPSFLPAPAPRPTPTPGTL